MMKTTISGIGNMEYIYIYILGSGGETMRISHTEYTEIACGKVFARAQYPVTYGGCNRGIYIVIN